MTQLSGSTEHVSLYLSLSLSLSLPARPTECGQFRRHGGNGGRALAGPAGGGFGVYRSNPARRGPDLWCNSFPPLWRGERRHTQREREREGLWVYGERHVVGCQWGGGGQDHIGTAISFKVLSFLGVVCGHSAVVGWRKSPCEGPNDPVTWAQVWSSSRLDLQTRIREVRGLRKPRGLVHGQ